MSALPTICLTVFATLALLSPAPAAILLFDFGAGGTQAAAPTNNISAAEAVIPDATDTSGSATGISVNSTGFNGTNTAGTQAPTGDAAIFDIASTRDSFFGNAFANFGGILRPVATVTFGGLDASGATAYSFDMFASRLGGTQNRETEYVVAGLNTGTVFLNAADNLSNIVSVNNIIPTGAGEITLTMDPGPNNNTIEGFYYLGALRMTSIPEPSSALMAVLGAGLCLGRRRRISC